MYTFIVIHYYIKFIFKYLNLIIYNILVATDCSLIGGIIIYRSNCGRDYVVWKTYYLINFRLIILG